MKRKDKEWLNLDKNKLGSNLKKHLQLSSSTSFIESGKQGQVGTLL